MPNDAPSYIQYLDPIGAYLSSEICSENPSAASSVGPSDSPSSVISPDPSLYPSTCWSYFRPIFRPSSAYESYTLIKYLFIFIIDYYTILVLILLSF